MSLNSTHMIHQLRENFEKLLTLVTGPEVHTATLDHMERSLFRQVLRLGFRLLHLFVLTRVEAESHAPQLGVGRTTVLYHSQKPTGYFSILGKLTFERAYFYTPGQPGLLPLDRALSLPERCYSNLLMESAEMLAVDSAYDKGLEVLSRLLGLTLSESAVETTVTEHSQQVKAFYRQIAKFPVKEEGPILVAQADGKGVPRVRRESADLKARRAKGDKKTRKREAVAITVYTIEPYHLPRKTWWRRCSSRTSHSPNGQHLATNGSSPVWTAKTPRGFRSRSPRCFSAIYGARRQVIPRI